jgi:dihydrofolate reductase
VRDADAWQNSILLRGDAAGTVAALKTQPGGDLGIIGSASLVRSLHAAALIDGYTLAICPLTPGSGARLFEGPALPRSCHNTTARQRCQRGAPYWTNDVDPDQRRRTLDSAGTADLTNPFIEGSQNSEFSM